MTLSSIRHQLQHNCDPTRIIHRIAVNREFLQLERPVAASEISCPRCSGKHGFYIPAEQAWACFEDACLDWQLGESAGKKVVFKQPKRCRCVDYGVPQQYASVSLQDIESEPDIHSSILQIVDRPVNFLLLAGSNGTGKTHAAACAIQAYLDSGRRDCRFISASDLHKEWKMELLDGTGFSTIQKYSEPELLVLDDLGIHAPTETFLDTLYSIVDKRALKGTIVTTNLTSSQMKIKFGGAIFSRLVSGVIKKMQGVDKRFCKDWN